MSNPNFGNIIKDLRQKNNLTQKELGEKLHISDKAISKWERGASFPDLEMLKSISEVFEIPISKLLGDKSQSEPKISNFTTTSKVKSSRLKKNLPILFCLLLIIIYVNSKQYSKHKLHL